MNRTTLRPLSSNCCQTVEPVTKVCLSWLPVNAYLGNIFVCTALGDARLLKHGYLMWWTGGFVPILSLR